MTSLDTSIVLANVFAAGMKAVTVEQLSALSKYMAVNSSGSVSFKTDDESLGAAVANLPGALWVDLREKGGDNKFIIEPSLGFEDRPEENLMYYREKVDVVYNAGLLPEFKQTVVDIILKWVNSLHHLSGCDETVCGVTMPSGCRPYLQMSADELGVNIPALIRTLVIQEAGRYREKKERKDLQTAVIHMLRSKLSQIPTMIAVFSQKKAVMEYHASSIADDMFRECCEDV